MKKVLLFFFCSNILLLACQNTSQGGGGADSSAQNSGAAGSTTQTGADSSSSSGEMTSNVADTINRCYLYTKNRDTVQLQVTQMGSNITGNLSYNLYEKDKNTGVINGTTIGDTLLVNYTFQSEGTTSTREEILIRQSDGYVLATGSQQMKGDKMIFTDRKKIKAGPIVLSRINCSN